MRRSIGCSKGLTAGELVVVLAIVSVIVLALHPFMSRIYRRMERAICANNIRELGKALLIYAKEHDGAFPGSLKQLYDEEYVADGRLADCPASKQKGSADKADYEFTKGLSVKDRSGTPLVFDRKANHKDGGNVLTVNGTVFWKENEKKAS